MKLEWFRQHKKFVYWVLLPVVGITMAFFGLSSFENNEHLDGRGPSVQLTINNKRMTLSESEVFTMRMLLSLFGSGGQVSSDEASAHAVKYHSALANGFEVGYEELREYLRNAVKHQAQKREPGAEIAASEENYRKVLAKMQMTATQFERVVHELAVGQKYTTSAQNALVNDPELALGHMRAKEVVRLRFKEFKTEDFMAQTKAPAEDKISAFYKEAEGSKEVQEDYKDILLTEAKLSADMLYFDPKKMFEEIKPTEDDLKKYYDHYKGIYWKKETKPGDPPLVAGEEHKPFESVKAEITEKWTTEEKRNRPQTRLSVLKTELDTAEKAHQAEQEKKPEAERKAFDLVAWAKSKDLGHWTTLELSEEQFKVGKKEVNAPDANWAQSLFFLYRDFGSDPRMAQFMESNKKRRTEFGYPQMLDPQNPDKGFVMARVKKYSEPQLKKLDEAKEAIANHLRVEEAIELCDKETKRVRDEWAEGKNIPALDTLDEITAESTERHALAQMFFRSPKAVGEVLDVAKGQAESANPAVQNPHRRMYVGFAVERKLPTLTTFEKDTQFDREAERRKIASATYGYLYTAFERQVRTAGRVQTGIKDPPLFDSYRRGQEQ